MSRLHTPEPWVVGTRRDGSKWISRGDRKNGAHNQTDFAGTDADAALTCAAPAMLEALKAVVRVADRQTVEFDLARAAIAKATALSSAAPMKGER